MTSLALIALALAAAVAVYAYLGYPLLLVGVAQFRRRRVSAERSLWPMVSLTIPAYNEEATIESCLERILQLDYPADRRQIIVVSDASTDRTDDIVRRFAHRGVELVRLHTRKGKTAAENAAHAHLRGEILVNADASVLLPPNALKALVEPFWDPNVGVASGRDISVSGVGANPNAGESSYVGYEMWVRELETRVDGIVGASGCFYAIRVSLGLHTVPDALSRDFAAPLLAREHGFRAVSAREAVCFVPNVPSVRREYRRKVRTMTRGLETLYYKKHLLNPWRYGLFAWMLWSHKLTRWLVPWSVLLGIVAVTLLASTTTWARAILAAGAAFCVMAFVGWMWPEQRRAPSLVTVPAYITSGLVAGVHAWVKALRGERNSVWEPSRRGVSAS